MSAPLSTIYLCTDVKLNNRYDHTIYFGTRDAQWDYFYSKVRRTYNKYTYLRKRWDIKVEASMDEATSWNYLFFRNPGEDARYYFVTDIEYVNDEVVLLKLELDVMQTYNFSYQLLPCFVEREHTYSDDVGEYTLEEGLDPGEYINAHCYDVGDFGDNCVLILSAINLLNDYAPCLGTEIDGVYSGLSLFAVDNRISFTDLLLDVNNEGKTDGIVSMWMYPKNLVTVEGGWDPLGHIYKVVGTDFDQITVGGYGQHKSKLFEGYVPRNNKLYTYPYNYLYVTNNSGTGAVYRYEFFRNPSGTQTFNCYGSVTPDGTVKIAPTNYKGLSTVNYDEGISLGGFPTCAWNSDTYKVWLAQNQNSLNAAGDAIVAKAYTGMVSTVANAATLNLGGAIGSLNDAVNLQNEQRALLAQVEDRAIQPAQSRGALSSNVNVASGRQTFSFYYKTLRKEYAQAIDHYFTMYGYKVNEVKLPSRTNRERFTYVKTCGCHIKGQMCDADTTLIERIYDKGITFWRDGDQIGSYLDPNPAIS